MTKAEAKPSSATQSYAAIDLGSNSFHMVVAVPEGDSIRIIDSLRTPVRLGAGLDKHKNIKPDTRELALDTLSQFAQRLRGIPLKQIRVVGTNTLRRAKNSSDFIIDAFALLGKRIEIISGREEARLIFSAVSHSDPNPSTQRLVIDIGGGSTELVIGKGNTPMLMESVNMGCVSYTNLMPNPKKVTFADFKKASLSAQLELSPIRRAYTEMSWDEVTGCSGTIKAVAKMSAELGISDGEITPDGLRALVKQVEKAGNAANLGLNSISSDRAAVVFGGMAVLHAVMKAFGIQSIKASQVALREGLIFDMIGKAEHIDLQSQTLKNLSTRYSIDTQQADRVQHEAQRLYDQVAESLELDSEADLELLIWAAKLHELGMGVAHTQYHKHGAYILENSDLLGFSLAEQTALALLVRFHRRKIDLNAFSTLPATEQDRLLKLLGILRLAVLLHRGRHDADFSELSLKTKKGSLIVKAPDGWMDEHPLTAAELTAEADRLLHVNIRLKTLD